MASAPSSPPNTTKLSTMTENKLTRAPEGCRMRKQQGIVVVPSFSSFGENESSVDLTPLFGKGDDPNSAS